MSFVINTMASPTAVLLKRKEGTKNSSMGRGRGRWRRRGRTLVSTQQHNLKLRMEQLCDVNFYIFTQYLFPTNIANFWYFSESSTTL